MEFLWLVLSFSVKAGILFALGFLCIRLWPRSSAAERHGAWAAILLAIALLVPLSYLFTSIELPFLEEGSFTRNALVRTEAVFSLTVFGDRSPEEFPWLPILITAWGAGAGFLISRFVAAAIHAGRLRDGATEWEPPLNGWPKELHVGLSSEVKMPMVAGIFRPRILLPNAAKKWPTGLMFRVLTHEAEHVRRHDGLWKLAGAAISSVYWFHPAVWYAVKEMEQEREAACDDAVLLSCNAPALYAQDLIQFARAATARQIPSGAIPMATPSRLESRIAGILDTRKQRQALRRTPMLTYITTIAVLLLPLSAMQSVTQNQTYANPGPALVQSAPESPASGPVNQAMNPAPRRMQNASTANQSDKKESKPAQKKPASIRVGGDTMQEKVLVKVAPTYPPSAKAEGVQGRVRLEVTVNESGKVADISVSEDPDERLTKAAIEAVSQWVYAPTHLNGEPVTVLTTVDINFTLK